MSDIDYLKWINQYLASPNLTVKEVQTRRRVLTGFFNTYEDFSPEALKKFQHDLMNLAKYGRKSYYHVSEDIGVLAHFGDFLVEKHLIDNPPIMVAKVGKAKKRLKGTTR